MPLEGVLRGQVHYVAFSGNKGTEPGFVTPRDQAEFTHRAGLRLGGMEPSLLPTLAAELSFWHEGRYRSVPGPYGYGGDRSVEAQSQLFWARALLVYNKPESQSRFILGLTGGDSVHADRFSAYRLGGVLTMTSEFPLVLPGYYDQELRARRFALLGGAYIVPLSADKRTWTAQATAATALVDYIPGLEQKGKTHTGLGTGLSYLSHSRAWQVIGNYGYGVDAIRAGRRGGQTFSLMVQFDFQRSDVPFFHPAYSTRALPRFLRGD
jgi:hypothetical protein